MLLDRLTFSYFILSIGTSLFGAYIGFAYPKFFLGSQNPEWMSYLLALIGIVGIIGLVIFFPLLKLKNRTQYGFLFWFFSTFGIFWFISIGFWGYVLVSSEPPPFKLLITGIAIYLYIKWFKKGCADVTQAVEKSNFIENAFVDESMRIIYVNNDKIWDNTNKYRNQPNPFSDWTVRVLLLVFPLSPILHKIIPPIFGDGILEILLAGISLFMSIYFISIYGATFAIFSIINKISQTKGKPIEYAFIASSDL